MLHKPTIIEQIRLINRSARPEWLRMFDARALRLYLEHLHRSVGPRDGRRGWVRRGDTAAIVTRRALH